MMKKATKTQSHKDSRRISIAILNLCVPLSLSALVAKINPRVFSSILFITFSIPVFISYNYIREQNSISIEFTGNAEHTDFELLLPEGRKPVSFKVNGVQKELVMKTAEKSLYVTCSLIGVGVYKIEVELA